MDEAEDEEEMEIEFTPVDYKKKARSPSPPNKKTPSVATANPFEVLSDDEDPIVITGKETANQKKARTKSKSPGRRRKSKYSAVGSASHYESRGPGFDFSNLSTSLSDSTTTNRS